MKQILASLIFLCFQAHALEELVVRLDTEKELLPLYIEPTKSASPYLSELSAVLRYDIAHSGHAYVSETPQGARVKLILNLDKDQLSLKIEDLYRHKIETVRDIPMSGELSIDRRRIHALSDRVMRHVVGVEGVASRRIIFATQTPSSRTGQKYTSEIWQCDFDGANVEQLTFDGDYSITPLYYPLGNQDQFFYVCYKNGPPKIYVSSRSQKVSDVLINLRGNQLLPTLSRDGKKMAFISDAGGRPDLFLQLIDPHKGAVGKPLQLYSAAGSVQASSSFSPDGERLVFVSDKDGSPRLYLIDLRNIQARARPEARCLTLQNRENTGPSWSPDGKKIAYSAKTNGIRQIWIYNLETQEECQLTSGEHHKENPCFAANSLHIVYNTTDAYESELYVINLNDPEPVRITSGPGKKHYPSWEP